MNVLKQLFCFHYYGVVRAESTRDHYPGIHFSDAVVWVHECAKCAKIKKELVGALPSELWQIKRQASK